MIVVLRVYNLSVEILKHVKGIKFHNSGTEYLLIFKLKKIYNVKCTTQKKDHPLLSYCYSLYEESGDP